MAGEKTEQQQSLVDDDLIKDAKAAGFSPAEIEAMKAAQEEVKTGDAARAKLAKEADEEVEEEEQEEVEDKADKGKEKTKAKEEADEEESEEKEEEEVDTEDKDESGEKEEEEEEKSGEEEEAEEEDKADKKDKATESERDEPLVHQFKSAQVDMKKANERLGAITKEKAELAKKLVAGNITAEDFADAETKLLDERDAIKRAIAKQQDTAEFNAQMQQNLFAHERASFIKRMVKEGTVDYTDKKNVAMLDRTINVLLEDPEFSDKGMDALGDLLDEAHTLVLARLGKAKPAAKEEVVDGKDKGGKPVAKAGEIVKDGKEVKLVPKDKQKDADGKAKERTENRTLAGAPAAAAADLQDETMEKLKGLQGPDLERAMASLPKKEIERLMRKSS